MERKGPQINHLSFADDIIIFTTGRRHTLRLIMKTLTSYEKVSGQLINKEKSHFLVPNQTFSSTISRIKGETGFQQKQSPISYLGCPLYIGRQRISHYAGLVSKVVLRIAGWQSKLLSYGGRVVLVKHVLQAIPIHIISACITPKTILKQLVSLFADFFWGWKDTKKKYHWASWRTLCLSTNEGGVGIRHLAETFQAIQLKQWWVFRSNNTLWCKFLLAKYCQGSML